MPVAIDTSVLVEAERSGGLAHIIPKNESGPFYVPALAAAEFLIGTHPPVKDKLRYRATLVYHGDISPLVSEFDEADAMELAILIADLKRKGQTMGFFDAAIAATAMARGDSVITMDSDYDRLKGQLSIIKA